MVKRRCLEVEASEAAIPQIKRLLPGRVIRDLLRVRLERGPNLAGRQERPLQKSAD